MEQPTIHLNNAELELLIAIIDGADPGCPNALAIRQTILIASRGIVLSKARRYALSHDLQELLSVGLLAIGEGLSRYDYRKSVYCSWAAFTADVAIRQHVTENQIVRVPKSSRRHLRQRGRAHEAEVRVEDLAIAFSADDAPSALDQLIDAEDQRRLQDALKRLTDVERRVLAMEFGLGDTEVQTPRQIARALNLRVVDVTSIRDGALGKLRGVLDG